MDGILLSMDLGVTNETQKNCTRLQKRAGREFSLYKNTYKSRGVVMLKREIEGGLTGMQAF
jgi:hypothetical protein